ncbi:D-lactate dehydrogenase, partial [Bacillus thuringiensis]|nr:D-lactate dehydrogenase [Bacillus thuringiensis]
KIHHHILTKFQHLPMTKKYIHHNIYNITKKYNKNTFLIINKLNTNKIPFFFTIKKHTNTILKKISLFKPHFTNHFI